MQKIYVYFALFLCLFFCLPLNAFAASPEFPSLPASEFENLGYTVFYDDINNGGTYAYLYDKNLVSEGPTVGGIAGSGSFQANIHFHRSASADVGYEWLYIYKLSDDGSKWNLISYVSADNTDSQYYYAVITGDGRDVSSITTDFYYSTDDIYYKGCTYPYPTSLFFPLTRFPISLKEAVETGLTGLTMKIQSSAVLLTSLAVGLMACLILVILLSTKLKKFLH